MSRGITRLIGAVVTTLALGVSPVWAGARVVITREGNQPKSVEIAAGEEVEWINAAGGSAHVSFDANDAIQFYIAGKGLAPGGSRVKFDKPGTYEYTVHVARITTHSFHTHTGTVVVK